jgi:hypothetical protein
MKKEVKEMIKFKEKNGDLFSVGRYMKVVLDDRTRLNWTTHCSCSYTVEIVK